MFFSGVVEGGKEWKIAFIIILVFAFALIAANCVCCIFVYRYKRKVCEKCKQTIREGIFILSFKTAKSYLIYKNDMYRKLLIIITLLLYCVIVHMETSSRCLSSFEQHFSKICQRFATVGGLKMVSLNIGNAKFAKFIKTNI